MGIKFATEPLAIEQNNYATKIVNSLDVWSKNPTINFKFKNHLVCASNIVKNSDKEKWMYGGFGITFDSAGS